MSEEQAPSTPAPAEPVAEPTPPSPPYAKGAGEAISQTISTEDRATPSAAPSTGVTAPPETPSPPEGATPPPSNVQIQNLNKQVRELQKRLVETDTAAQFGQALYGTPNGQQIYDLYRRNELNQMERVFSPASEVESSPNGDTPSSPPSPPAGLDMDTLAARTAQLVSSQMRIENQATREAQTIETRARKELKDFDTVRNSDSWDPIYRGIADAIAWIDPGTGQHMGATQTQPGSPYWVDDPTVTPPQLHAIKKAHEILTANSTQVREAERALGRQQAQRTAAEKLAASSVGAASGAGSEGQNAEDVPEEIQSLRRLRQVDTFGKSFSRR